MIEEQDKPDAALAPAAFSKGENLAPRWTFSFVDLTTVEADEVIVPAKLAGALGEQYADMHAILDDLQFAHDALAAAATHGPPDPTKLEVRALISSAIIAYARPFVSGVRSIKLTAADFVGAKNFDANLHDYLFNLRQKHIAHSVNEFERAEATGVVVGRPPERPWSPRGVGVTLLHAMGVSLKIMEATLPHTEGMLAVLNTRIERIRPKLFEDFRAQFERDGKFDHAPMVTVPNRGKVGDRRT